MEFYDNTEEETNPFLEAVETVLKDTDEIKEVLQNKGINPSIKTEWSFGTFGDYDLKISITFDYQINLERKDILSMSCIEIICVSSPI